ncbi:MAG: Gldg family protein [Desulfobacterales bacterium]|jgi:ABC-type uncharacterized transport system involved in gliding motility auxiliary subunit
MAAPNPYGKYGKLIVYLAVVVLINLAGITLFFRVDLTENGIYSISKASRRVVSTLSEPLTINVFFSRDLPAPYNGIERYLRDLLEEYALHGNAYFNYRFFDVDADEGDSVLEGSTNQKLADSYGINPVQIQAIEQDEVKFKRAYMGMVMIHGDQVERIPTIATTEGLEYKVTTAIQKLNNKVSALLNLDDKIRLTLYMSSSLKEVSPIIGVEALPTLPEALEKTVADLNARTYDKLDYRLVDPATEAEQKTLTEEFGLVNLKWPAIDQAGVSAGSGVIGLVMTYGEKVLTVPLLNVYRLPIIGTQYEMADIDTLDRTISDGIDSLIDINETLGYLADFGTPSLFGGRSPQEGGMSTFNTIASRTYSFNQINAATNPVPESIETLLVVRPTEPLSDYALYQIDQALMRGTNLALFIDAFTQMTGPGGRPLGAMGGGLQPFDTGLEKLLTHYGIHISNTLALDENCYKQPIGQEFGGGEQAIYFAPIIQNENITKEIDVLSNIKGLIALQISPLETDEKRLTDNGLTAHRLFSSSDRSWRMEAPIRLDPMAIAPPPDDGEMESLPLAYLIEGSFPSYFAGKPVPERPNEEADGGEGPEGGAAADGDTDSAAPETAKTPEVQADAPTVERGVPAKILLVASAEMVQDRVLDPDGQSPNAMFVMNMIDHLNGRDDIAVMRSKVQRFNPLAPADAVTKTAIKTVSIAGLPILVVLFGLGVWVRRRSRKKAIQQMFETDR